MSSRPEVLKAEVFKSTVLKADNVEKLVNPESEVKRYADVIEATLAEGEGTYTGTVASTEV